MLRPTTERLGWLIAALLLASGLLGLWLDEWAAFRNAQFILAPLMAVWAWRWPTSFAAPISRRASGALLAAALVWLELASWSHWASFGVNGVDFSIFDWMLESTHEGRFGYSPIYGVDHFGVHSTFLLLGLVPLHALWPGPGWLVALGPALLWAGLAPMRRLSHALVGPHGGLELALTLAWLGNPWLGRLANGAFRIESFTPALTAWFLVGWVERRGWLTAASVLALLCAKEDAALALSSFGIAGLVFEPSRRRWAALVTAGSLGFLIGYTQLLQPMLTHHSAPPYWGFWSDFGDSPGRIVVGLLTSPGQVALKLITSSWWRVFLPLLLLPFGSRRAMSGMAPTLFLLGVANPGGLHEYLGYHPSPLIAWALFGVIELVGRWRARAGPFLLGLTALLAFGVIDGGYAKSVPIDFGRRAGLPNARAALEVPATRRCIQSLLMPQVGYPRDTVPLFELECVDEPGAVGLVFPAFGSYPFSDEVLSQAVERWRAQGRVRELGSGFLFIEARPTPGR